MSGAGIEQNCGRTARMMNGLVCTGSFIDRQRMFSISFKDKTTIDNQKQLNQLFRTDCLFLQEGASIVLSGDIALGPNVIFVGTNRISGPASIEAGSVLTNVDLGRNTVVRCHSIISNLKAGDNNLFGPFCFIRDDCVVENDVILGAHVETARSSFGSGVKISHRAFVGDARIGRNTIIGAGTYSAISMARAANRSRSALKLRSGPERCWLHRFRLETTS
jgi:bifunctional UDP-N-acetylglucosamine pyrophosphorylase/glucosamine-1-phosphate N-acetyltransferase